MKTWFGQILKSGSILFQILEKIIHARVTYLELIYFLYSWSNFKKNEGIPLINNAQEPPVWWRFHLKGSNQP
jgi:hypothetical protein